MHRHPWMIIPLLMAACRAPDPAPAPIIGGTAAGPAPWMATLFYGDEDWPFCGGSLIAPGVVLTAAHCVARPRGRILAIGHGLTRPDELVNAARHRVSRVILHPGYRPGDLHSDLALIMAEPVDPVPTVALNSTAAIPAAGSLVRVLGWGTITSLGLMDPERLMEVTIPAIPGEVCRAAGGLYAGLDDTRICAGSMVRGGRDACTGDSGGPLLTTGPGPLLVGVVSGGDGCAGAARPGVYTRVSAFHSWITTTMADTLAGGRDEGITPVQEQCYELFHHSILHERNTPAGMIRLHSTLDFEPGDRGPSLADPVTLRTCDLQVNGQKTRAALQRGTGGGWQVDAGEERGVFSLTGRETIRLECPQPPLILSLHPPGSSSPANTVAVDGRVFDLEEIPAESGWQGRDDCRLQGYGLSLDGERRLIRSITPGGPRFYRLVPRPAPSGIDLLLRHKVTSTGPVLEVVNTTDHPVYAWQVNCPFPFSLTDHEGQDRHSREDKPAFGGFAVRFPDPLIPPGTLPARSITRLGYRGETGVAACTINHMAAW